MSPDAMCGEAADAAVYALVDEAVAAAALRGATSASLSVQRTGTNVTVGFEDDGAPTGEVAVHLADRVGAVGGSVAIDATSGTRT